MKPLKNSRLIESDAFPFEFLSQLAERESWRKELHRPIYHVHKWWAKRLGSVFRGILLGSVLPPDADLSKEFYCTHNFGDVSVLDPFMGSGTTVGEAHKLGMVAFGRDINPVAVRAVTTAFGPMHRERIKIAFDTLSRNVGQRIRELYTATDSQNRSCDVLYHFWVMQAECLECSMSVDLFPSYIIARNANPRRKLQIRILCPKCGGIFPGVTNVHDVTCHCCGFAFNFTDGPARGARATCTHCHESFAIVSALEKRNSRPAFRHYAKLVLRQNGEKEYLPVDANDIDAFTRCSLELQASVEKGSIRLPDLALEAGHNTRQAMNYKFNNWRDFFNDRQLLGLAQLYSSIHELEDAEARDALATLFSGVLEFNNLFASYKGEGTGAVRHMFSHHILKPERTPIEANIWGTPKSSGSFSSLFRGRLLRAIDYRENPTELNGMNGQNRVCSLPFTGVVANRWPNGAFSMDREIFLSCGDSASTDLPEAKIDLVVTDPPFFDNVHYSELADFFHAWHQLYSSDTPTSAATTRHENEVQDADSEKFSAKLERVFSESRRVVKDSGLLVFTYHHSRDEGWHSLADAILNAGFIVINSHPVKAEMSVATPKSQAKEPINFDIVLVCRKSLNPSEFALPTNHEAIMRSRAKLSRLQNCGFQLSRNDRKIAIYGQLLTTIETAADVDGLESQVENELSLPLSEVPTLSRRRSQGLLFNDVDC